MKYSRCNDIIRYIFQVSICFIKLRILYIECFKRFSFWLYSYCDFFLFTITLTYIFKTVTIFDYNPFFISLFLPYQDFCEQESYMISFLPDFRKLCICFVHIYRLTLNQYRKIRKFSFEVLLYIKIIYIKHIMNNIFFLKSC